MKPAARVTAAVMGALVVGWLVLHAAMADAPPASTSLDRVQARIDADLQHGRPLVVHSVVGLCDNLAQGIVPVPASLGNGQKPRTNLYWGAAFGVRTFFRRHPSYRALDWARPQNRRGILDRAVFRTNVDRRGRDLQVVVVAEAWDGRRLRDATERFLQMAAGHDPEDVELATPQADPRSVRAGGEAALLVLVGHNGLMDFAPPAVPTPRAGARPRAAMVLACASRGYFSPLLTSAGASPLLLTTGLMAPEAYTLEAVITAFARGDEAVEVRRAAARAYHRYQKCGLRAAEKLFWVGS